MRRPVLSRSRSSPRPWGCFPMAAAAFGQNWVVPTPVGVFPPHWRGLAGCGSRPHARGGVSAYMPHRRTHWGSSPRPWGCFRR